MVIYNSLFQRKLPSGTMVWAIDYDDPITGKRHRKHLGTIDELTREDAEELRSDLIVELYVKKVTQDL